MTDNAVTDPTLTQTESDTRVAIGEIIKALGERKADDAEYNALLAAAFGVRGGISRVQDTLRARVRQFMELEGEDTFAYEGWVATLGAPPQSLYIDETDTRLTDAVIGWALRQGLLTLDATAWRATEKRETAELEALRQAVHTREGTSPLSVGTVAEALS